MSAEHTPHRDEDDDAAASPALDRVLDDIVGHHEEATDRVSLHKSVEPAPGEPVAESDDRLDDEDEDDKPVLVDVRQPRTRSLFAVLAERQNDKPRAVIPAWLRDRKELEDQARWALAYVLHHVAYHLVRVPKYGGRLALCAPRGFGRAVGAFSRWLTDAEAKPLLASAIRRDDPDEYHRLIHLRSARTRWRWILGVPMMIVFTLLALLVGSGTYPVLSLLLGTAALLGFGAAGLPADKPLLDTAVVKTVAPALTSLIVSRALGSVGIAQINQAVSKGGGITFPCPITRDGPGWRAEVDLPYGVTAADVIDKRDKLASGLRRPMGCVWPEPVHEQHAGRMVLWVGDQDMSQAKPLPYPLATAGKADIFKPLPFGVDQRGRPVSGTIIYDNVLIGAMPRQGKTFSLRVFSLGVALDPTVQIRTFELKGTGDMSAMESIAHAYASGQDDETIALCMDSVRDLVGELATRAKVIQGLPKDLCPENKVTRELADRKSLGLHPIVLIIDECQELFTHPECGTEAGELITKIIKLGPALGVMLLLATQRPDAKSLPTGVSANVGIRLCLRVMGQTENDMVLGTSMYKNGVRATTLTNRDKGIGYLAGVADDPMIARGYYIDGPAADRIAARAKVLREKAGTLTGHAAGETTTPTKAVSVLDDVAAVLAPGEDKAWNETLIARLAELRPEHYGDWKPAQLTAALKPYGIDAKQVWLTVDGQDKGANRRGIDAADLRNVITQRNRKRGGPSNGHGPAGDIPGPR